MKPAAGAGTPAAWPEPLRRGLAEHDTRYYGEALGIPGCREVVAVRLSKQSDGEPGGIYNAPGVAYWRPLAEAFDGLAGWKLGDFPFDPEARRAYVERFLGWGDGRSSARLLDLVERVAGPAEAELVRRP